MGSPELEIVILAGGQGTRFWPASRAGLPKQFLAVGSSKPLLRTTFERLAGLVSPQQTWIVTSEATRELTQATCPEVPASQILGEPSGKNTLPAIAWAALSIEAKRKNRVMVVLPADHIVGPLDRFQDLLRAGASCASARPGRLVTFGIRPTWPATGMGWIKTGEALLPVASHTPYRVDSFVEKPKRAVAESFLEGGQHLWNSGMFAWRTDSILAALGELAPRSLELLRSEGFRAAWQSIEPISIDHGVLEHSREVVVLPADLSWSDVGSWESLAEVTAADAEGNHVDGGALLVAEDSQGCLVHGPQGSLTTLLGVKDLIVVRMGDAILVANKRRGQEVRRIVERIEAEHPEFR